MYRIIIWVVIILLILYYVSVVFQFLGIVKFTNRKMKTKKALVPFYYFFKN